MEYRDLFEYNDIQVENKFRFSPSSFNNFYNNPKKWYEQQVLKQNTFKGNTQTVLGTIVHSRIGAYWLGIPIDEEVEVEYISRYDDNPEVDCWKLKEQLDSIWDIVPDHITQMKKPTEIEKEVVFEIPNTDYILAGSLDYIREDTLGDIKTTSTTPKKIKVGHRIQLYLYLLALRMNNEYLDLKNIEVLYIVKTKTPKIVTLVEPIDEEYLEYIKQEVKNMIKRLELIKQDESMLDILFFNNQDSYL